MTDTAPRSARLQAIRDKWFTAPLPVQFPPFTSGPEPTTCNEFVRSERIVSAFSTLQDGAGDAMSLQEAKAQDEAINLEHFRTPDPRAVMNNLGHQFDAAVGGQPDPEILKKSAVILEAFKLGSLELAAAQQSEDEVKASYVCDAQAASKALELVKELAADLGVSLPVQGSQQRQK